MPYWIAPVIHHFLRVAKPESSGHLAQGSFEARDALVSNNEIYRNTLTYALAIAGSERMLAERLGVTIPQLLNWLMGIDQIPTPVFLDIVDVVLTATEEEIRRSRSNLLKLQSASEKRKSRNAPR